MFCFASPRLAHGCFVDIVRIFSVLLRKPLGCYVGIVYFLQAINKQLKAKTTQEAEQTANIKQTSFGIISTHSFDRFSYTFGTFFNPFYSLIAPGHPFGVLGLLFGPLGPQVGKMTTRGVGFSDLVFYRFFAALGHF